MKNEPKAVELSGVISNKHALVTNETLNTSPLLGKFGSRKAKAAAQLASNWLSSAKFLSIIESERAKATQNSLRFAGALTPIQYTTETLSTVVADLYAPDGENIWLWSEYKKWEKEQIGAHDGWHFQ